MRYGTKAIELLKHYYQMDFLGLDENMESDSGNGKGRLLLKLEERRPEKLNYLGVSFGLTEPLLKFWKLSGFVPTYLRWLFIQMVQLLMCF